MADIVYEWGVLPIQSYMDNLSYISKRVLITDSLHNRDISAPFSKKEIISYAYKEAENNIFSASYSAIEGYKNDVYFIGKPAIDPFTNEPNSQEEQAGLFGNISNSIQTTTIKLLLIAGASIYAYKKFIK